MTIPESILALFLFLTLYKVSKLMANQSDLQAALDAQAAVIKEVQAEVAKLEAGQNPVVDLAPQVAQVEAQTAALQALLPAPPSA